MNGAVKAINDSVSNEVIEDYELDADAQAVYDQLKLVMAALTVAAADPTSKYTFALKASIDNVIEGLEEAQKEIAKSIDETDTTYHLTTDSRPLEEQIDPSENPAMATLF